MKEITGPYLDTQGACRHLGVSIATLYRLIKYKRYKLPAHRVGGTWRFIPDELNKWVLDNRR